MKIFTQTLDWTDSQIPVDVVIERTEDHWESIEKHFANERMQVSSRIRKEAENDIRTDIDFVSLPICETQNENQAKSFKLIHTQGEMLEEKRNEENIARALARKSKEKRKEHFQIKESACSMGCYELYA